MQSRCTVAGFMESIVQTTMEPKHTAAGEDQWSQCVEGRYAGMISPSITDSRSCCHPLLIVLKVKETPRDGVRHTHTHMEVRCVWVTARGS